MNTLVDIFLIIGTVSFAISGAMKAIKHGMDLFGVVVLGVITAVGGGVLRDVVIGNVPPAVFTKPRDAVIAVAAALISFLIVYFAKKKLSERGSKIEEWALFVTDTLGLGVFTVIGVQTAMAIGQRSVVLLVFVGIITGAGGGVLRDICAGTVPAIFVKHIYALASIMGALVFVLTESIITHEGAFIAGFITVVIIRTLAALFKWNLPKIEKK